MLMSSNIYHRRNLLQVNNVKPSLCVKIFKIILQTSGEHCQNSIIDINDSIVNLAAAEGLSLADLEEICKNLEVVARIAINKSLSANKFSNYLNDIGLSQDLATSLANVWEQQSSSVHDRFVNSSFDIAPERLTNASWKLKLITGQNCESNMKQPLVEIGLTTHEKSVTSLEFDHESLSDFYKHLENIQHQIDLIQKQ